MVQDKEILQNIGKVVMLSSPLWDDRILEASKNLSLFSNKSGLKAQKASFIVSFTLGTE